MYGIRFFNNETVNKEKKEEEEEKKERKKERERKGDRKKEKKNWQDLKFTETCIHCDPPS